MATFNGALVPSGRYHDAANVPLSTNLSAYQSPLDISAPFMKASAPIAGAASGDGVVQMQPTTFDGHYCPSFYNSYYDRIWVIPQRTDFGNLTGDQIISIEVWNAYQTSKLLSAITTEGQTDGTILTGRSAGNFAPLESVLYSLRVTTNGSPQFDGRYIWNFPNNESPFSRIVGRRVIPFPFQHNWTSPVNERVGYLNGILRAFTGKEQRFGLRKYPRRTLEYTHLTDKNSRQRLDNLLMGWQQRTFALPIWTDVKRLTSNLPPGSTSLAIDTLNLDYETGGLLLLWESDANFELIEIQTLAASSVGFKSATQKLWKAGTKAMPIRLANVGAKTNWTKPTSAIQEMRLNWQLTAGQAISNRLKTVAFETYRTAEIWNPDHNWAEQQTGEQTIDEILFDFGYGTTLIGQEELAPYRTTDISFEVEGRDKISEFWAFIERRSGTRVGFWFERPSRDFTLAADAGTNATTLIIAGANYTQFAFPLANCRDITIRLSRTSIFRRRITGAVLNADGTETITIDAPLGVALTASSNPIISYLRYARLDSDDVETSWLTSNTLQVKLRIQELLKVP